MTPEKQRIAIAGACGWSLNQKTRLWKNPHGVIVAFGELDMPDYLNDLNAIHEAEKVLWDTGKAMEFSNQLVGVVCSSRGFRRDKSTPDDHLMCLSHATAAQRCEAFLRTLNRYKP